MGQIDSPKPTAVTCPSCHIEMIREATEFVSDRLPAFCPGNQNDKIMSGLTEKLVMRGRYVCPKCGRTELVEEARAGMPQDFWAPEYP